MLEAFHRQALDALRVWSPEDPNKLAIVVRDLTSQQVVNTRLPWGQPLPKGSNPEVDKEVVQSMRPVIQGVFVGATSGRPIVSIRVPVIAQGQVTHVLSMAVEPERFAEIIGSEKLPAGWVGTLVDREERVIARSREHERYVGKLVPAEFRTEGTRQGGVWTSRNLNNEPNLGAYERSAVSGWMAYIGVPMDVADQPLRRSLEFIAALGVLALALSFLLAIPFGDRIALPLRTLASSARMLGRGQCSAAIRVRVARQSR